jgi:hypothetical protein
MLKKIIEKQVVDNLFLYLTHEENEHYLLLLLSNESHWNGNVLFIVS